MFNFRIAAGFTAIRIAAGFTAILCCVAVVTALAGVGPETVAPVAVKGDRLDISSRIPDCSSEPWPYGCQWQVPPARRLTRNR
jgi:hypothetical protein